MPFFGTREEHVLLDEGRFDCPVCQTERPYRHYEVRANKSVFWMAVTPSNHQKPQYVECAHCETTYTPKILAQTKGDKPQESQFTKAMRRVLVAMMLADGEIASSERTLIRWIFQEFLGETIEDDALYKEAADLAKDVGDPLAALAPLAPTLNDKGRRLMLRAAFTVAMADDEFHPDEKALAYKLADALEISAAQADEILASLQKPPVG